MKELSALKVGHRYTLVKLGDMGFPFTAHLELASQEIKPYAQYAETMFSPSSSRESETFANFGSSTASNTSFTRAGSRSIRRCSSKSHNRPAASLSGDR